MYIKANVSSELKESVRLMNSYLSQITNHQFIDQLDPRAQLGCHPYHITLIGSIQKFFKNFSSSSNLNEVIQGFLQPWQIRSSTLTITPTNTIKITKYGKVLWLVQSEQIKQIADEMFACMKAYGVNHYCQSDLLHITLGVVQDPRFFQQEIQIDPKVVESVLREYGMNDFGWDY